MRSGCHAKTQLGRLCPCPHRLSRFPARAPAGGGKGRWVRSSGCSFMKCGMMLFYSTLQAIKHLFIKEPSPMKRRSMINMSEEEIRSFLEEQRTLQVATIDHDGYPH